MNYFKYKLISPKRGIRSGYIKLPYTDPLSAIIHLERDGSTAIFTKKIGRVAAFFIRCLSFSRRRKLSRSVQAELLSNISLMIRSGLTLTTALEEAAESSEFPEISNDINDIITSIKGGAVFSEAIDQYRNIFPETIIHLIRIGEKTGQLDKLLKDGSDHLTRIDEIISDTKQALLYPSFVFIAMGALFAFWFYYVIPKIINLFKEMDVTLPLATTLLLNFSNFLQANLFQIIAAALVTGFTVATGRRTSRKFKKATDALLLRLPLAGTIISASTLAFITEYLSLLLNAGIDLLGSLSIIRDSVKNEIYREKLEGIRSGLTRGNGITESFTGAVIFPKFVTRMIGVGEMSGTMTEQLAHIAEEYRNKLSIIVSTLGKMLEPLILIIAGVMFAAIVGGLLLPIYDLISKISG